MMVVAITDMIRTIVGFISYKIYQFYKDANNFIPIFDTDSIVINDQQYFLMKNSCETFSWLTFSSENLCFAMGLWHNLIKGY